jgi:hypothetical protein
MELYVTLLQEFASVKMDILVKIANPSVLKEHMGGIVLIIVLVKMELHVHIHLVTAIANQVGQVSTVTCHVP